MTGAGAPHDSVTIERMIDAPIDVVWRMWTEDVHFAAWYGPNGATIPVANLDVRVGGSRRVCMEVDTPRGPMRMWFTGKHIEVVHGSRLVYTESMSDEAGNVLSPTDIGMPEGHPMTTEVHVDFEDIGGRTKMTMTHAGIASGSPGAAGWTMAFDKLDTYLNARR